MDKNYYKYYIEECLETLIERTNEAHEKANSTGSTDFDKGRLFGYQEVMNYLIGQAEVFGINEELDNKLGGYSRPLS